LGLEQPALPLHRTPATARWLPAVVAVAAGFVVYFAAVRDAGAVPSFARKYQTSCQTCHTIYPVLNPFGEAFRRDGYRFPSSNGSEDSDAVKANMIPLGQEEYKKTFPDTVWPDKIAEAVPLSVMINGNVPINLPGSAARATRSRGAASRRSCTSSGRARSTTPSRT
jgi:mono/diheme cytochrome c family protein